MRRVKLGRVVRSKTLGSAPIKIIRRCGDWVDGRFVPGDQERTIQANVQPASVHELEQLPEGERIKGMLVILSCEALYISSDEEEDERISDELLWKGNRYKIMRVDDWSHHGFYKAYAGFKEVIEH